MKLISVILILAIVDVVRFFLYILYIAFSFHFIVKYFIKRSKYVFKILGVSPYLFNCFDVSKYNPKIHGDDVTCIICCEEITEKSNVIVLTCHHSHIYHSECITGWLHKKFFCPVCKSSNIV